MRIAQYLFVSCFPFSNINWTIWTKPNKLRPQRNVQLACLWLLDHLQSRIEPKKNIVIYVFYMQYLLALRTVVVVHLAKHLIKITKEILSLFISARWEKKWICEHINRNGLAKRIVKFLTVLVSNLFSLVICSRRSRTWKIITLNFNEQTEQEKKKIKCWPWNQRKLEKAKN